MRNKFFLFPLFYLFFLSLTNGLVMTVSASPYPTLWNIPLRYEHYVSRGNTLKKIETQLEEKILTLVGIEGIGKTQLAKEYAHTFYKKYDIVLYSTPPITFTNTIRYLKNSGALTYLLLKDIFPQNAVDLGMMKKGGLIYNYFLKKEKQLFHLITLLFFVLIVQCCFYKSYKQWMRIGNGTFVFWMKLNPHKPRMSFNFYHFHQA